MSLTPPPAPSSTPSSGQLLLVHLAVGLAVIAGVVVLCALGKLDTATTTGAITAVLGLGAGGTLAKL